MPSLVWLGGLLAVVASMSGTAGKQLLRFSHLQREKGTTAALCVSKAAMVGGLVLNVIVGPLLEMGAFAFAPQSTIAPLTGLDVVWNTLSAPCSLGETLTFPLICGCLLIAAGATTASGVGNHEEMEVTLESLKATLFRWAVLGYMITLLAWLAFNILVLMPRSAAPKGQPFRTGDTIRGLSLGMTAGSIAGNMFCVKGFVNLVKVSIAEDKGEFWLDWLPYVLLIGAVFFATSNLYFLTKAMCEYEALFMGAVFEGSLIIAACISGCVVFSELDHLEVWKICLYWLAVLSIVCGIWTVAYSCMNSRAKSRKPPEVSLEDSPAPAPGPEPDNTRELDRGASSISVASSAMTARSTLSGSPPFRQLPLVMQELADSKLWSMERKPPAPVQILQPPSETENSICAWP